MIGDVLTSSVLFEIIKSQFPDYELHYLINSHTYPVVQNHPFIDDFVFFTPLMQDQKLELLKLVKKVRHSNYDVIIDLYSKLSSNLIVMGSKAKTKISFYKSYTKFLYSHTFKNLKPKEGISNLALLDRLQLLKPLGINIKNQVRPKIYLTPAEREASLEMLKLHQIDLKLDLYMISVLGSDTSKSYPFDYMAKVLELIVDNRPNCQIIFNYMPKQRDEALEIYEHCSKLVKSKIHLSLFGSSLRSFLSIASYCHALIGNEGGAINMAKALNVPTFTIFSPWIRKESWNLFEDGKKHVALHLKDIYPEIYKDLNHPKDLKTKSQELYRKFKPELLAHQLRSFLKNIS